VVDDIIVFLRCAVVLEMHESIEWEGQGAGAGARSEEGHGSMVGSAMERLAATLVLHMLGTTQSHSRSWSRSPS